MEKNEELNMKNRFLKAVDYFGVTYNKETGVLSEPITIVAYQGKKKIETSRVVIMDNMFIFMDNDVMRRLAFDKVTSFRFVKNEPETY